MSNTQPASAPASPPSSWFLPWWLPGLVLGVFAAASALVVAQARLAAQPTHRAEAFVQLTSRETNATRQQRMFLLRSRDLLTRTLAEPAVAELPSVKGSTDPATGIAARLAVAEATPEMLSVTLTGNDPDDMKVLLTQLVKRYVDDATMFDRKDRDDQLKRLEQLSERFRLEIEAMEKQIELIGRANGTTGGEENAKRLAFLQQRHIEVDAEFVRVGRELGKLEAEMTVLQRQLTLKIDLPPDPAREARLSQLGTTIEVKKEERQKLREERDALQKLITAGVSSGINITAMRQSLLPQREQLQKIEAQLAALRVERAFDRRVSIHGEVTVAPTHTAAERRVAVGVPAAVAFAAGFVLATALSFVGLVFRVLRRAT